MALLLGCLKVFMCRVLDVSLGTVRTMFMVRGKSLTAALIGFCEVFIWYVVVKDALSQAGPVIPIAAAYAGGFATGTYIGSRLSKTLIKGYATIQVITTSRDESILEALRAAGYGISVIDVNKSPYGDGKFMILANVPNKKIGDYEALVESLDPGAFIMSQDTKSFIGGYLSGK